MVVPRGSRLAHRRAADHQPQLRPGPGELDVAHLGADRVDSFDESVPKGVVMSTDPGAGAEVRRGTDVKVTVSKGPERYAVPNVVNKSAAEARDQITAPS